MRVPFRLVVSSFVLALMKVSMVQACVGEMQFIGYARNVHGCQFDIQFTLVKPNQVCPLIDDQIDQRVNGGCDTNEGDEVSGVIVKHGDGSFSID